jgi:hypothetical protein
MKNNFSSEELRTLFAALFDLQAIGALAFCAHYEGPLKYWVQWRTNSHPFTRFVLKHHTLGLPWRSLPALFALRMDEMRREGALTRCDEAIAHMTIAMFENLYKGHESVQAAKTKMLWAVFGEHSAWALKTEEYLAAQKQIHADVGEFLEQNAPNLAQQMRTLREHILSDDFHYTAGYAYYIESGLKK